MSYNNDLFYASPRKKTTFVFCTVLIFAAAIWVQAQQAPKQSPPGVGNLQSLAVSGGTLTLRAGGDTLIVQVVEPNILRVHYRPQGQASPPTPVLDPSRLWRDDIPAKIDTNSDPIVISTDRMIVKISKKPLRFAIYDAANRLLLEEPKEGGVYGGGLRFAYKNSGPFFGIEGTSMQGIMSIRTRIFVPGCGAQGARSAPVARGTAGRHSRTRLPMACLWIQMAASAISRTACSSSAAARVAMLSTLRS